MAGERWTVTAGGRLGAFLREQTAQPWSAVKRWIETGKVSVDGRVETAVGRVLAPGAVVGLEMAAPRPRDSARELRIVFEDAQLAVVDKPPGISTVPFEHKESGTAMDLLRDAWRRQGKRATAVALHVVHRIDRATSGLVVFAKTRSAERGLGRQFRDHTIDRAYLCVAHGEVASARIESRLVQDRGDGLRGSTRDLRRGKRAVTHVRAIERLRGATLCEVKLETGKTHQIRIHLAEGGHPLVGETVYVRDHAGPWIESPRLLLHAAVLGFVHPTTGSALRFESPLPADFERAVASLRG
jgi:23S rRNA pseudouridine1911/1915/1917 synthase